MRTSSSAIDTGAAETVAELVVGQSYSRMAHVEHNVINANPYELTFIETEVKR